MCKLTAVWLMLCLVAWQMAIGYGFRGSSQVGVVGSFTLALSKQILPFQMAFRPRHSIASNIVNANILSSIHLSNLMKTFNGAGSRIPLKPTYKMRLRHSSISARKRNAEVVNHILRDYGKIPDLEQVG